MTVVSAVVAVIVMVGSVVETVVAVKFFGITRVNIGNRQVALFEVLLSLFSQMRLKEHSVAGVALEHGIDQVANKRCQTNGEIKCNVEKHLKLQSKWEAALNLVCSAHDHKREETIHGITGTVA